MRWSHLASSVGWLRSNARQCRTITVEQALWYNTSSVRDTIGSSHIAPDLVAVALPVMDGSILDPGHTVASAGQEIVGGLLQQLSVTVMVKLHCALFPQPSVAT